MTENLLYLRSLHFFCIDISVMYNLMFLINSTCFFMFIVQLSFYVNLDIRLLCEGVSIPTSYPWVRSNCTGFHILKIVILFDQNDENCNLNIQMEMIANKLFGLRNTFQANVRFTYALKGALDNILKFYFWLNFIYHVKCNC